MKSLFPAYFVSKYSTSGVYPARVDFTVFALKNAVITLNILNFCWFSFLSLHMWKILRNLQSSFLHFVKKSVCTYSTLMKP